MPDLLAALGQRLPNDPIPSEDVEDRPVEELTLELTDPFLKTQGKVTRAAATARLIYRPAGGGPAVESLRFTFVSTVGTIEHEDLRWYLEEYFRWPIGVFQKRAEGIEQRLPGWGHDLYNAAVEDDTMVQSWKNADAQNNLRFTVFVDPATFDPKLSKKKAERLKEDADEASALLLGLPWELLHDEKGYLFKGARPVYIRRRLPNRNKLDVVVTDPPVRILLVSPRPEDDRAGYIDHRVSAIPLVEAMESLGDMVDLTILSPPTFSAMTEELTRARDKGTPYHVVHFDGHGVFDTIKGLGALCFEDPEDIGRLEGRGAEIVDAERLAETIRDHRIPLFFLDACQRHYQEALEAHEAALKAFEALQEPGSVAIAHHQIGMVYEEIGDFDRAEAAYKNVLRIEVQQKNDAGQASSSGQLGNLYDKMGRPEEGSGLLQPGCGQTCHAQGHGDGRP